MGYRLNRLDESVLIAVSKPLLTEFEIHHRLENCGEVLLHEIGIYKLFETSTRHSGDTRITMKTFLFGVLHVTFCWFIGMKRIFNFNHFIPITFKK